MRLFAASFLLSAMVATPALAQDESARPFEGVSATAIVGVDNVSANTGGTLIDNDRDATGVVYGGQLGYDWQRGSIVFGVEGEVAGASTKYCYANAAIAGDRFCDKADRDLYIGGRVGKVVGGTTLFYLKAGYTNVRDKFDYSDGGSGAGNYVGSSVLDGVRGGVGVEHAIGSHVLVKAEYRYSNYENDYSRNQGVVGIGFRF